MAVLAACETCCLANFDAVRFMVAIIDAVLDVGVDHARGVNESLFDVVGRLGACF